MISADAFIQNTLPRWIKLMNEQFVISDLLMNGFLSIFWSSRFRESTMSLV